MNMRRIPGQAVESAVKIQFILWIVLCSDAVRICSRKRQLFFVVVVNLTASVFVVLGFFGGGEKEHLNDKKKDIFIYVHILIACLSTEAITYLSCSGSIWHLLSDYTIL